MKLNFLGRGSAFNVEEGNTSAYYKDGNDMLLIDCGSDAFKKIVNLNLLDDVHDLYIAITHSHPDHIGSLGDLVFYCYYVKRIRVHFLSSKDYDKSVFLDYLKVVGVPEFMYSITVCYFTIGNRKCSVEFVPCSHVEKERIKSFSIIIQYLGKYTLYSGDTNSPLWCLRFIMDEDNRESIDYIYHEASLEDKYSFVHSYLDDLIVFMGDYGLCEKLRIMHIDNRLILDEVEYYHGVEVVECVV